MVQAWKLGRRAAAGRGDGALGSAQRDEDCARLIAGIAREDRAALRALYEATAPKLLGIILRIVGDRGAAEDTLQEVFVRIWQRAGSYDAASGTPLVWLAAIARHRAIDRLRQDRSARVAPLEDGWIERLPDPWDGEADLADRDALVRCLDRVEGPQRECLVLAYCEGWSREELAERHGKPVNTIKTWLRRGLLSLRGCLEAA
ncbi:sigma-70 family RNA polymerase sigma factor [Methylobacterium persicinum]|uniref:RNA polymerase sigma-70 factor (ECF subfamily) n=1 Tax=Methylobacterium persicinum TaxID=374426 RepID=A0ABU0HEW8_9HYPH|nr:sigma-70 family RNA polymerase sigma factor [Methylobacterium persicinum]MDQ0440873.1 RNA polymerase sigma-70 factor (ECF subfamily) [Methylobacterium persicinum]GJE39660.1 ECF RNA polymerase sigma factor SigK [Methylobacterium persicinum]